MEIDFLFEILIQLGRRPNRDSGGGIACARFSCCFGLSPVEDFDPSEQDQTKWIVKSMEDGMRKKETKKKRLEGRMEEILTFG